MNPYYHPTAALQFAEVTVSAHRQYDGNNQAPWLLTIDLPPETVGLGWAYPRSRAVVDDFGSLVTVREWL